MNKVLHFIIWPTIAGLVFAFAFLQLPRLTTWFPGLLSYFPTAQRVQTEQPIQISYSDAIKKAAPAVVSISSQQENYYQFLIQKPSEDSDDVSPSSNYLALVRDDSNNLGSGVIISPDGYIITSYHLFFTSGRTYKSNTMITFNDGTSVEARSLLIDEANDLALLKVNLENLPFLLPAPQQDLEVGNIVLAIGNPRNIGQSVSLGIISALLRRDDSYVIQTDAAINPGNSGGALIDINGKLLGINTTIVSESGGSEGIGFATPASIAINLLSAYLASNPGGYVGIQTSGISPDQTDLNNKLVRGIQITDVDQDSPAEKAGVLSGDIITGVNGNKLSINSTAEAFDTVDIISGYGAGKTITLEIFRAPTYLNIPITLGLGDPILEETLVPITEDDIDNDIGLESVQ